MNKCDKLRTAYERNLISRREYLNWLPTMLPGAEMDVVLPQIPADLTIEFQTKIADAVAAFDRGEELLNTNSAPTTPAEWDAMRKAIHWFNEHSADNQK